VGGSEERGWVEGGGRGRVVGGKEGRKVGEGIKGESWYSPSVSVSFLPAVSGGHAGERVRRDHRTVD
jgi:uncharacterized protein YcfJ